MTEEIKVEEKKKPFEPRIHVTRAVREKRKLKKANGYRCVYCGCTNRLALTIDHKVPIIRGGTESKDNKCVACYFCNQLKDNLTDKEYKKYYRGLVALHDTAKISVKLNRLEISFTPERYPATLKELLNREKKEKKENENICKLPPIEIGGFP